MMLTSDDPSTDGVRCEEPGIKAYLVKPVRQQELQEAISEIGHQLKLAVKDGDVSMIERKLKELASYLGHMKVVYE